MEINALLGHDSQQVDTTNGIGAQYAHQYGTNQLIDVLTVIN